MNMTGVDKILAAKLREIEILRERPLPSRVRARFSFREAVARPGVSVIAEIKRSSPSHGDFGIDIDQLHAAYLDSGVHALSILTDAHFGMSPADLTRLGARTNIPILRKDFILDEAQIREADSLGADAILLIASFLDKERLARLGDCAERLGLDVLYEIHGISELEKLPANATLVGVNNRNLSSRTYATDLSLCSDLAERLPSNALKIAESGYTSAAEVPASYDAVLIGAGLIRTFLKEGTVKSFITPLLGPPAAAR